MFWTPFTKTVRVYGKHHRGCAETVRADLVEKTPGKVGQDPNKHFTWYSRSTSDALEKNQHLGKRLSFLGSVIQNLYIYIDYISRYIDVYMYVYICINIKKIYICK